MANPAEPVLPASIPADAGFDPLEWWIRHKGKVMLYGALLVGGLAIYTLYEMSQRRTREASIKAFAAAGTADELRAVTSNYPNTVAGGNARLMLADTLRDEGKLDEAVTILRDFLARKGEHPLLPGAHASLAATLEQQGKLDEALAAYQQVTNNFSQSFAAPGALMATGRIFKAQGRMEEAKQAFDTVSTRFQGSAFGQQAVRQSTLVERGMKAVPAEAAVFVPTPTAPAPVEAAAVTAPEAPAVLPAVPVETPAVPPAPAQ